MTAIRSAARAAVLALTLGAVGVVSGCASTETAEASATPINDMCAVVHEHPVTAEGGFVMVGDDMVGFCCEGCQAAFEDASPEKQAEFVQLFKQGRAADFEL